MTVGNHPVTGTDDTITFPLAREPGMRPARPGESRFWCSCDTNREHPFFSSGELVQHVMDARKRETGQSS